MKMKCDHGCGIFERDRPISSNSQGPKIKRWIRKGSFRRKSDSKFIQRWACPSCGRTRSQATGTPCFGQNKRRVNFSVYTLLCSNVTQKRVAKILHINVKTVARKFQFMSRQMELGHGVFLSHLETPLEEIFFDELETHEHSKLKPLSIPLVVTQKREIVGFGVASMPARGKESKKALKKYGYRADKRIPVMRELFQKMVPHLSETVKIHTDEKSAYGPLIRKYLPNARHCTYKGRAPRPNGLGELKKGGYDPLFPINHTAAMLRANMNRLNRRTWSTTKKPEALLWHLGLYAGYHNRELL